MVDLVNTKNRLLLTDIYISIVFIIVIYTVTRAKRNYFTFAMLQIYKPLGLKQFMSRHYFALFQRMKKFQMSDFIQYSKLNWIYSLLTEIDKLEIRSHAMHIMSLIYQLLFPFVAQ